MPLVHGLIIRVGNGIRVMAVAGQVRLQLYICLNIFHITGGVILN